FISTSPHLRALRPSFHISRGTKLPQIVAHACDPPPARTRSPLGVNRPGNRAARFAIPLGHGAVLIAIVPLAYFFFSYL
ncbi:unnamed protein product, partial [Closterium sp. Naga37s-1]